MLGSSVGSLPQDALLGCSAMVLEMLMSPENLVGTFCLVCTETYQIKLLWLAVYLLMLTRDFKTEQNSNSTLALLLSVAEYIKESAWFAVIENHKLCDLKDRKLFSRSWEAQDHSSRRFGSLRKSFLPNIQMVHLCYIFIWPFLGAGILGL